LVEDLFDPPSTGRPPRFDRRIMLNACLYVLRTGCAWRMLPRDFPPWNTVFVMFKRWAAKGVFERAHERLRVRHRQDLGKAGGPTAAIIDSQAVKTGPQGGDKGYDAGKKVKGRKRHLVTDFLGLLLAVLILPASIQDRDAALAAVQAAKAKQPSIEAVIADNAYSGQCAKTLEAEVGVKVEIIKRPTRQALREDGQAVAETKQGFILLPKRWIIERTNGWMLRFRRLVIDHDRSTLHAASWLWLAGSAILWRRIAFG
jgi:putative transposase